MQKILVLALFAMSISCSVRAQLWKLYSDSAKNYATQNDAEKALDYYLKAKKELSTDSLVSGSYLDVCRSIAILYASKGMFDKAEPVFIEIKQIREKLSGRFHAGYGAACHNLARVYYYTGRYDKAESFFLEAIEVYEKVFGKDHLDYASSCDNLGIIYYETGEYKKAETLYIQSKNTREKLAGKKDPVYAYSCNNLALLYMQTGKYDASEQLFLEARQIHENKSGKLNPEYARCSNNLGIVYKIRGWYDKSETFFEEAAQIREKLFGKENRDYAETCHNLAGLCREMNRFEKSVALYTEAKNIRERVLTKNHPSYGMSCLALAVAYKEMGMLEKAESLLFEAKEIFEKTIGNTHPDYAANSTELGNLYTDMGQYEKADIYYKEAKIIWQNALGTEHETYGGICSNLASLYQCMGRDAEAEQLYLESNRVWEKVLGKDHPDYARSNSNLSNFYVRTGKYSKAEALCLESMKILEKTIGNNTSDYAFACESLGDIYASTGRNSMAEPLFIKAKEIWETNFGKTHQYYAVGCSKLGDFYRIQKNPIKAGEYLKETILSQSKQLNNIFQFTSEKEQQLFIKKNKLYESSFYSFMLNNNLDGFNHLAFDISVSNRNLTLTSSQQLRNAVYITNDTAIDRKYNAWINLREQIVFWQTKPMSDRSKQVSDFEEQANNLEKELTRLSSDFRKQQKKEIDHRKIQSALKPGEVAIEFIEFPYHDGIGWTDSTYYVALVLRNDKPEVELVKLFEERELNALLKIYKGTSAEEKQLNFLYSAKGVDNKKSLYDLIWKPVEYLMEGIHTVYFAAAGSMYKISFSALPVTDKQLLSDKYKLVQLNTTAAIIDQEPESVDSTGSIVLYGGVLYDMDPTSMKLAASQNPRKDVVSRSVPDDLSRDAIPDFIYLAGAEKEINGITSIAEKRQYLNITVRKGKDATEESFKDLAGRKSPEIIHIATHGFFFKDPKNTKLDTRSGGAILFRQSDNPLIRSGLALAGANNMWKGKPVAGIEDGILTAYEVSNMYLPNTKLAVLSACETGLGDIQGSEGVYGLQRAFKIAGVENLVMSLWKVPDMETAEFMQVFYKNLFAKQSIPDAFYNTQTIMKNKYRNNPFKWAAWVLIK